MKWENQNKTKQKQTYIYIYIYIYFFFLPKRKFGIEGQALGYYSLYLKNKKKKKESIKLYSK